MPEDSEDEAFSEPRTPSLDGVRSQDYYTEDGAISLSPPPSPSMSLHSLGMSPLSPLRHSPVLHRPAKPHHPAVDHDSQQDLSQDSRDVLVQRLSDLVSRLSGDGELLGNGIANLHARVDEMEHILSQSSSPKAQKGHGRNPSSVDSSHGGASMLSGLPSSVQPKSPSPEHLRQMLGRQSCHCSRTKLHEALLGVVANLKARQEEQDHIHALLITRAERAAQRIIYLEERVQELEEEQSEGEMDILNLQIQLSAIEVQCMGYIPKDADPELMESINLWKAEWNAVKRKRALRKGDAAAAAFEPPEEHRLRASAVTSGTPN
ncbi:hypothetical protein PG994_002005 [Apiospora phragmitis]|uniref:Uncharacterized protein n=1 Tax=Apiospora phragmitis TaxID=2905665 RepID=A0ABR1WV59_9PEZI